MKFLHIADLHIGKRDPAEIIGISFCLSKKHSEFMAQVFNKAGIPSEFLVAESESAVRDSVKRRLVTKEITFVFVVDISMKSCFIGSLKAGRRWNH
ncbi:hypothetical protein [Desulfosporosinus sp. BICA1-9]|uniref:hypothetical protein n=1 Tax=Desulfosporosinus sp. BICA1-9 TaxID=1531958 RepID=UPI00054C2177|nr:hypothetical protein [Desulfosporosinus sp. BICA1-9]KJS47173.1 MAG: hypothetical protein VR66_21150 [Peptococcaceae bacterium BRH_c23]KJS90390.1 MAG: hypothetical protein JL57_02065 [Desulfosporosinus sp. BICA1-9]HBW39212.1 hypothetical protein [Desulfosporosinus sp.]